MNLVEMLDRNARKFAAKEALRAQGRGVTFSELKDKAERIAASFRLSASAPETPWRS